MENNRAELMPAAVSVGHRLKDAREKKGLGIDQVQQQTRIHSTVVHALEEGRAGELLTDTYVRSFLKKYAQFLGVNSTEILKEYFPARQESASVNAPGREIPHFPKEPAAGPKFLYFTAIAAGAVIVVTALFMLTSFISAHFKHPKSVEQKKVALAVKKRDAQNAKAVPKKRSHFKEGSSETKELIPRSTPLILTIKVRESVLLSLKKDGVLIFDNVLRKDMVETVTANNIIELGHIGKARALELTLNGKPVQLPGEKLILGVEITRKGVRLK